VSLNGLVQNFVCGTTYTVLASNGTCTSNPSASFTIQCVLPVPTNVTIATTAASCTSNGVASITNYNASFTYVFVPAGPTVNATGVIGNITCGTTYTVIARSGANCQSQQPTPFVVNCQSPSPAVPVINVIGATCLVGGLPRIMNWNANHTYTFTPLGPVVVNGGWINGLVNLQNYTVTASAGGCTSGPSPAFNNGPLAVPQVVQVTVVAPTCTTPGSASITNFLNNLSYSFTPTGPTVNITTGAITGFVFGVSYTVIASNGSCSSPSASTPFSILQQLTIPAVPVVTVAAPTCAGNGVATITNYVATMTYIFTPDTGGITVGAGGVISGIQPNQSYTITADNGSCQSPSPSQSFSVLPQLVVPPVPAVNVVPPTCSANGTASITNYDPALIYTFAPTGPSINPTTFEISGASFGVTYTLTVRNSVGCTASTTFSVLAQLPVPNPQLTDGFICLAADGTLERTYLLNPQISGSATYAWTFDGQPLLVAGVPHTASTYTADLPGVYSVTVTNGIGCVGTATAIVAAYNVPTITDVIIERWFEQNVRVTVVTSGAGNYLYQFNNEPWQQSNVFENVPAGPFTVRVINAEDNACGSDQESGLVVNFPPFFTPNGDGYNDRWNIVGLNGELISIFDRYGKLVAQITAGNIDRGWDGTYNNLPLPSTDYWFSVDYLDQDGIEQTFKAHFSMKR
jgi:gliding motility-associated-like protein